MEACVFKAIGHLYKSASLSKGFDLNHGPSCQKVHLQVLECASKNDRVYCKTFVEAIGHSLQWYEPTCHSRTSKNRAESTLFQVLLCSSRAELTLDWSFPEALQPVVLPISAIEVGVFDPFCCFFPCGPMTCVIHNLSSLIGFSRV